MPETQSEVAEDLLGARMLKKGDDGRWCVTNLGAALLARDLGEFDPLHRKAVRLIQYQGPTKASERREHGLPQQGYALVFERLMLSLNILLPQNEVIGQALRSETKMYPERALRELAANALIHQDFTVTGAGPVIELFPDRLVFRNPGGPLVPVDRFLDRDRARNALLTETMRRLSICEQSGSGVDKVVQDVETWQLPAPQFREEPPDREGASQTSATLYAHKAFAEMSNDERVNAAYWHTAFAYVTNRHASNESLRKRFGLSAKDSSKVSRVIRDAVEAGWIRPVDPEAGYRIRRYLPNWA